MSLDVFRNTRDDLQWITPVNHRVPSSCCLSLGHVWWIVVFRCVSDYSFRCHRLWQDPNEFSVDYLHMVWNLLKLQMFEGFWMVVYKEKSSPPLVRPLVRNCWLLEEHMGLRKSRTILCIRQRSVKKGAELNIMRYQETEIIDTVNIAIDKLQSIVSLNYV